MHIVPFVDCVYDQFNLLLQGLFGVKICFHAIELNARNAIHFLSKKDPFFLLREREKNAQNMPHIKLNDHHRNTCKSSSSGLFGNCIPNIY